MRKLVLFDIDGTLVLTGRAGIRALNRACRMLTDDPDALAGIEVNGRTDRLILANVLTKLGREFDLGLMDQLRDRYLANLREEIEHPGQGTKAVMPGVRVLLDALERRDDVLLALLTGNFETGARIKLEHFDLWRYFRCGAFGDDAADRNALVPFAVDRALRHGWPADIDPEHILVVGDTPHDVRCATVVGATPIAVATGGFSTEQLRASGAGIVFEDLSDTQAFLRIVDGHAL